VLETLQQGKPMLALPVALDQPAIAHHLKRLGIAKVLPQAERSIGHLCLALLKLKQDSRYAEAARGIQGELQRMDGAEQAALIIEEALQVSRSRKQEGAILA
jgi:zeaxanthin glucosyltransferase